MEQFEMLAPNYYAMMYAKMYPHENHEDFGEPNVPVLVRHAEGVRVVLGTHDSENMDQPEIQIERRPNGWAIFLHPIAGGTSGLVYFLDDGRSYLLPDGLPNDEIRIVQFESEIPLLDDPPVGPSLPEPTIVTRRPTNPGEKLAAALAQATAALARDSNDDEHDALLALVEALSK